jgi:hypothetical protein
MYSLTLLAHSWLRWLVLAAAVLAVVRALKGRSGPGVWTAADERTARLFTTLLDIQMLLGLLLFFVLSPFMAMVRDHLGEAMGNDAMRYWLVEHPVGMVVAIALAHVGRARIRKTADPRRKHRLALIFFGLALVAAAASVPWPGMATGRPLFRSL